MCYKTNPANNDEGSTRALYKGSISYLSLINDAKSLQLQPSSSSAERRQQQQH